MKRASNVSDLLDRSTPWLAWWQELILNWVATWETIETLHVTSSKTDQEATWEVLSTCLKWGSDGELTPLDAEPGKR
jgi:hypothetical protein